MNLVSSSIADELDIAWIADELDFPSILDELDFPLVDEFDPSFLPIN